MKPRLQTTLAIGLVLLVASMIVLLRAKPEPKYNGRALSDWLSQLVTNYPRTDREAVHALNAMGGPAVQALIETARNGDSPVKQKLLQYSDKLPILGEVVTSKVWSQWMAVQALGAMGTNAISAIPTLKMLEDKRDEWLSPAARAALVLIRNESLEALALEHFDLERTNSSKAFGTLLRLGPHAKATIPILLDKLQSTNERIRLDAALLLESVGIESPECLPVFAGMLTNTSHLIHRIAISGLANSGSMATSAAPAAVELLDDPEINCRHAVLNYLWLVIPPESFSPFHAKVQKATADTDPNVRESAVQVLSEKRSVK